MAQGRELLISSEDVTQREVEGWDVGGDKSWQDWTRRPSKHIAKSNKFFKSIFSNENGQRTGINQDVDPEGLLMASAHMRAL